MGKKLYVTIDPCLPVREDNNPDILVKPISDSYLEKSFEDLIQAGLNPEGYNAHDKSVCSQVQGWFGEMNANPNEVSVDVVALSTDEPPEEIRVGLSDFVSQYASRIVKDTEMPDASGASVPCKLIDLCVAKKVIGGLDILVARYQGSLPEARYSPKV